MSPVVHTLIIGLLATAAMDVWGIARPLLGFPRTDYRLIGRWFAYMPRGRFRHDPIATSPPLPGEHAVGLLMHYAIGITFAFVLVGVAGEAWLRHPTLAPALLVGIATVAAPLLLMQPGMGAGIAASRTRRPGLARMQAFITHAVYGLGLYAAGLLMHRLAPLT